MRTLVLLLMASAFLVDLVDPSSPFVADPCKAQVLEQVTTGLFHAAVKRPRTDKPVNLKPFITRLSMQYLRVGRGPLPAAADFFSYISLFNQNPPAKPYLNSPKRPPILS